MVIPRPALLLWAVCVLCCVADAATTGLLLSHGGVETNPLMLSLMHALGVGPALGLRVAIGAFGAACVATGTLSRSPRLLRSGAYFALVVMALGVGAVAFHNWSLS